MVDGTAPGSPTSTAVTRRRSLARQPPFFGTLLATSGSFNIPKHGRIRARAINDGRHCPGRRRPASAEASLRRTRTPTAPSIDSYQQRIEREVEEQRRLDEASRGSMRRQAGEGRQATPTPGSTSLPPFSRPVDDGTTWIWRQQRL